jgi:hypothetical protein
MRVLFVLMLAGCSNMISPIDSPEKKAAYAECESREHRWIDVMRKGGAALVMEECMRTKGY